MQLYIKNPSKSGIMPVKYHSQVDGVGNCVTQAVLQILTQSRKGAVTNGKRLGQPL
jgi:hypothetical protein